MEFLGLLIVLILFGGIGVWRLSRYLVLRTEERRSLGYQASRSDLDELLGAEGFALTPLRPAGTARFGDRRVDVVADSEFIAKDTPVRVVQVEGSRVVVRACDSGEATS